MPYTSSFSFSINIGIRHMPKFRVLIKSPIRKNILANFYGIGVNLLNQIILVPLYIVYWGNDLYSDWIIISALTVIFSMSDIGLNSVIQNRFSMKYSGGDIEECKSLLANNILIVTAIFAIALLLTLSYMLSFNIVETMGLHSLERSEANVMFLLLICRVFLGMYSGIENAVYRASHRASRAVYMDQTCTLCTVVITIACLCLHIKMVYMCFSLCIPYIILLIIKKSDARKYFPHKISIADINMKLLKALFVPSVSFMSFPLGNAIVLQGYTLVVNKYFGTDCVVLFNTTRTMCNFIKTFLSTIQNSVWPEYSIAYGNSDYRRMRNLHRKTLHVTIFCIIVICSLLLIFGPLLYRIWTHGEVDFQYPLMCAFLVVLFFEMIWTSSGVTLMSTNNHVRLGLVYVSGAVISIITGIILSKYCPNIVWLEYTVLIMQCSLVVYTIRESLRLTKDKLCNLMKPYGNAL